MSAHKILTFNKISKQISKNLHLFFALPVLLICSGTISGEYDDLEMRIYKIEKRLEGKTPVLPVDSELFNVSGFLSGFNSFFVKEPYKEDGSKNISREHLMFHNLNFSGKISKNTQYIFSPILVYSDNMFSAVRINAKPVTFTTVVLVKAYGEYNPFNYLNIRFGRFMAPGGAFLESWNWVAKLLPSPEMIGQSTLKGLYYNMVTDGIQISGIFFPWSVKLKYYLYGGLHNFLNPSKLFDDPVQIEVNRAYAQKFYMGARLKLSLFDEFIDLGLSLQAGQRYNHFKTYGADITLNYNKFKVVSEYVVVSEDEVKDYSDSTTVVANLADAIENNRIADTETANQGVIDYIMTRLDSTKHAYYIEPTYRLSSKWTLASRFDYFHPRTPIRANGSSLKVYSLGVVVDPRPLLRLGFIVQKYDFKRSYVQGVFDDGIRNRPTAISYFYDDINQLEYNKKDPDYMSYRFSIILNF